MIKKENTVVFIGHSACYSVTSEMVTAEIVKLIERGAVYFFSGGQGGFDRLCAECVARLKKSYPQIENILVIPYLTFHIFCKNIFDAIVYPSEFEKYHFKAAIPARNKYMVDHSAFAVCYVKHDSGGAAKTYEYAKKKGLEIIDL